MKLYATTTSERATKGQGGNNYLRTDYFITSKDKPQMRVIVDNIEDNGVIVVRIEEFHFSEWHEKYTQHYFIETKGEKQKTLQ